MTNGLAPSRLRHPWSPRPEDRVGFFGCSAVGGQLIRIGWLGGKDRKPPRTAMVDCPACGQRHLARPTWRRPGEGDEGCPPALILDDSNTPPEQEAVS